MLAIKKILCPVDFSSCSAAALDAALDLATKFDSTLTVMHVYEVHRYVRPDLTIWTHAGEARPLSELARDQAVNEMDELSERCKAVKVEASFKVVEGLPVNVIVETAEQGEYDLLVLGTHGRTGLSHLLMGSVAERVVRASPIPVLTFKEPQNPAA